MNENNKINYIFGLLNPTNTMTVNRPLAFAIGLQETVMYQALLSKYVYYRDNNMLIDGEWFYSTVEDLEESTTLSRKQQTRCADTLIELKLIKKEKRNSPPKNHYCINFDLEIIENLINKGLETIEQRKEKHSAEKTRIMKIYAEKSQKKQQKILENRININNVPNGRNNTSQTDVIKSPKGTYRNVPNGRNITSQMDCKSKDNKTKDINLKSINLSNEGMTDAKQSQLVLDIQNQIGYEILTQEYQVSVIDLIVSIIKDVYNGNKDSTSINGITVPKEQVVKEYKKITVEHIRSILDAISDVTETKKIKNIRSYIQTCLYNAPSLMDTYTKITKGNINNIASYDIFELEKITVPTL